MLWELGTTGSCSLPFPPLLFAKCLGGHRELCWGGDTGKGEAGDGRDLSVEAGSV